MKSRTDKPCWRCDGTGYVWSEVWTGMRDCMKCSGTGLIDGEDYE